MMFEMEALNGPKTIFEASGERSTLSRWIDYEIEVLWMDQMVLQLSYNSQPAVKSKQSNQSDVSFQNPFGAGVIAFRSAPVLQSFMGR
jgi:hypothetical protein